MQIVRMLNIFSSVGMSEFCAQNWLSCAELTKRHRNCKIL